MILYVAEKCYDYEGFIILGIFDNKIDAEKRVEEVKNSDYPGNDYDIAEIELNK